MSGPLSCSTGDGKEAKFIVGNADTGEQQFLCLDDMAGFGLAFALQVLNPQDVIEAAQLRLAAAAKGAKDGAGDPGARKTATKAKARKPRSVAGMAGEAGGSPAPQ